MTRLHFVIALILGTASAAPAQTPDHLFRSWRWQEDVGSPRAAGMAGAFAAVADDFSASLLNPAGLTTVPGFLEGSLGLRVGTGQSSAGPDLVRLAEDHRRPLGSPSGLARLGCRWGVAAYHVMPLDARTDLGPAPLPDGSRDQGFLDLAARGFGGAAAGRMGKVAVGVGASVTQLQARADDVRLDARGVPLGRVVLDDRSSPSWTWTVGALYLPMARLRAALLFRSRTTWTLERRQPGAADPFSERFGLHAPFRAAAGVAWTIPVAHRGSWLTSSAQLDWIGYSALNPSVAASQGGGAPADYRLKDALEPRVGVELSIPTRCWHGCGALVQVRGGLHSQAGGSLRYSGRDPVEAGTFVGSGRRWRPAVGGSVAFTVLSIPMRIDSAVTFGAGTSVLAALSMRYGVSFRDRGPR